MARIVDNTRVLTNLPVGVRIWKELPGDRCILLCEHSILREEPIVICPFCLISYSNQHPESELFPPVKVLVRMTRPKGVDRSQQVLI